MAKPVAQILLPLLLLLLPSQLALHFWPSWTTISGFKVDYLSPTLYFTDLLVLGILASHYLADKKIFSLHPQLTTINLSLVLMIITNILFSLHPHLSLLKFLRLGLYYFLFKYLVSIKSYFIKSLSQIFPMTILWVSVLAVWQFVLQTHVGGLWYWLGERPLTLIAANIAKINLGNLGLTLRSYATFPHPNALAGFLATSLFIVGFLKSKNQVSQSLFYCVLGFGACGLILTFSRSVILVSLVMLAVNFFHQRQTKLFVFLLSLFTVYCLLSTSLGDPSSLINRIFLSQTALLQDFNHPLLGLGLGTFPYISSVNYQPVHNVYLLLVTELGLPFAVFVAYLCIAIIKPILKLGAWELKLAILTIGLTGMIDHYWLTSVQNLLLLTVFISLLKIESPHASS